MSRRKLVAANWKMHLTLPEGDRLADQLMVSAGNNDRCDIVIAPPFPHIPLLVTKLFGTSIKVGAQHCHHALQGAFTGEVSVPILKSFGVAIQDGTVAATTEQAIAAAK